MVFIEAFFLNLCPLTRKGVKRVRRRGLNLDLSYLAGSSPESMSQQLTCEDNPLCIDSSVSSSTHSVISSSVPVRH